jgi:hypothetical protein
MKRSSLPLFKGRFFGIVVLVAIQLIVGVIHVAFGLVMLSGNLSTSFTMTPTVYSIYTLVYGSLTFLFACLLWMGKRSGWIGTVLVSLFVIAADTLTALNLLTYLGIPKSAAIGEIPFSIIILTYLIQSHVRTKYNI